MKIPYVSNVNLSTPNYLDENSNNRVKKSLLEIAEIVGEKVNLDSSLEDLLKEHSRLEDLLIKQLF